MFNFDKIIDKFNSKLDQMLVCLDRVEEKIDRVEKRQTELLLQNEKLINDTNPKCEE